MLYVFVGIFKLIFDIIDFLLLSPITPAFRIDLKLPQHRCRTALHGRLINGYIQVFRFIREGLYIEIWISKNNIVNIVCYKTALSRPSEIPYRVFGYIFIQNTYERASFFFVIVIWRKVAWVLRLIQEVFWIFARKNHIIKPPSTVIDGRADDITCDDWWWLLLLRHSLLILWINWWVHYCSAIKLQTLIWFSAFIPFHYFLWMLLLDRVLLVHCFCKVRSLTFFGTYEFWW